jgi:hypothetical protein
MRAVATPTRQVKMTLSDERGIRPLQEQKSRIDITSVRQFILSVYLLYYSWLDIIN